MEKAILYAVGNTLVCDGLEEAKRLSWSGERHKGNCVSNSTFCYQKKKDSLKELTDSSSYSGNRRWNSSYKIWYDDWWDQWRNGSSVTEVE